MPLGLSEEQQKHFQNEFQLSYHLENIETCTKNIPLCGLDVLEIGGSLPASLVIDHLYCNS